jgi:predicted esterase
MWVDQHDPTERVLTSTLGFRPLTEYDAIRRYTAGNGGPGTFVNVRAVGGFLRGTGGAGTVHHVAWAVTDDAAQLDVRARVVEAGLGPTPVIDRNYFHSVYFHEPGGVLFELATNPPGFTVDEPPEHLGEHLKLPAQYESSRTEIEAILPRIHLPVPGASALALSEATGPENVEREALGFVHRYIPPHAGAERAGSLTLLMLHGTGGDENDLVPLAELLVPGAGVLSPRGNVLEGTAPRFFRRLAEGVFDQADMKQRTGELAAFIHGAAETYGLDRTGIVAVGFSNGANIAASLLLRGPKILRWAVLLSPMVPFEPETVPDVSGVSVFIGAGRSDPLASVANVERLAALLRSGGAEVTVHWEPGGHTIARTEIDAARQWILKSVLREDVSP